MGEATLELEQLEEQVWNNTRVKYEEAIIVFAKKLIEHTGCNNICLPFVTNKEMFVQIIPKEYNDN